MCPYYASLERARRLRRRSASERVCQQSIAARVVYAVKRLSRRPQPSRLEPSAMAPKRPYTAERLERAARDSVAAARRLFDRSLVDLSCESPPPSHSIYNVHACFFRA